MLLLCPTPIGNLDDATPRQLRALREADVIACEDTRTTGKLLELLGIDRDERGRLMSYHDHNAEGRIEALLAELAADRLVVLVSDAGTPSVSDPGFKLVRAAIDAGHEVSALPGPVAGIVALCVSGMPTDRFLFEGFLPSKSSARKKRLGELRALGVTTILYESPHRVIEALADAAEVFGGDHHVALSRELTKRHEEHLRGPLQEVIDQLQARDRVRGECVVTLAPGAEAQDEVLDGEALDARILALLDEGHRVKHVRDMLTDQTTLSSSELYARIQEIKQR